MCLLLAVKDNSPHTIGVEFNSKVVRIGDKSVKLQVSRRSERLGILWKAGARRGERVRGLVRGAGLLLDRGRP